METLELYANTVELLRAISLTRELIISCSGDTLHSSVRQPSRTSSPKDIIDIAHIPAPKSAGFWGDPHMLLCAVLYMEMTCSLLRLSTRFLSCCVLCFLLGIPWSTCLS